jgi:hypothetical protein
VSRNILRPLSTSWSASASSSDTPRTRTYLNAACGRRTFAGLERTICIPSSDTSTVKMPPSWWPKPAVQPLNQLIVPTSSVSLASAMYQCGSQVLCAADMPSYNVPPNHHQISNGTTSWVVRHPYLPDACASVEACGPQQSATMMCLPYAHQFPPQIINAPPIANNYLPSSGLPAVTDLHQFAYYTAPTCSIQHQQPQLIYTVPTVAPPGYQLGTTAMLPVPPPPTVLFPSPDSCYEQPVDSSEYVSYILNFCLRYETIYSCVL